MTDNVLSASLGQLTGLSGEAVQHSDVVKSFSSYSARQHADQPLPDAHRQGILSQRSSAYRSAGDWWWSRTASSLAHHNPPDGGHGVL